MHPVVSQITGLRPPILPLDLMLKPLRKRFRYHFYGKKQTNDLSKVFIMNEIYHSVLRGLQEIISLNMDRLM